MVVKTSKLAGLPVSLPTKHIAADVNVQDVANSFSDIFSRITDASTYVPDAVWRDILALTGTIRTFYSPQGIVSAYQEACQASAAPVKESLAILTDHTRRMDLPNGSSWIDVTAVFAAQTKAGLTAKCMLAFSVVPGEAGDWKIWQMRTILTDIDGWPSVNQLATKNEAATNGHTNGGSSQSDWVDVAVVGGGASGLSVGGRLQALGVKYVVLDKYAQIGDSWGSRYDSARLHTPRNYAHLPFTRTFPQDEYEEFIHKDDVARGYRNWAQNFGIDKHVWVKTELLSGAWDDAAQSWTLKLNKDGTETTLRCRFVVMAIGAGSQIPLMPDLPGKELFKGITMHSKNYKNAKAWKGKGVVVGSGNTSHDLVVDMYKAGLQTTMIQRGTTYVLPYEYWQKVSNEMYNDHIPTDLSDTILHTSPAAVARYMINMPVHAQASMEPERFEALTKAGFTNEKYGDLAYILFERGGSHFMDVGTGQYIVDGKIKIQSGEPVRYTETGLVLNNGTEVPADVIVWSTGFLVNIRQAIAGLLGKDVGEKMDDVWGIDDEGEFRGLWKIQHPGLLLHGAELGQARFWSKYVALQIKAALEGKPFAQYRGTPVPPKLSAY